MPLYEFDCQTCGAFERRLDVGAAMSTQHCDSCSGPARRVFTAVPFHGAPSDAATARESTHDRLRRARTGEPRIERRPEALPSAAQPKFEPLGSTHTSHRH